MYNISTTDKVSKNDVLKGKVVPVIGREGP
jgi:hypothetical protein